MEIERILVLSTAHISESTADEMNAATASTTRFPVNVYGKSDFGWFIFVPSSLEYPDNRVPEDLQAVLRYARENDCEWIMFDRDADIDGNLQVFDW